MMVGFCPCAALDDVCMRRQTATVDNSHDDDDGSGDEHLLYYRYYSYYDYDYHNDQDFDQLIPV